MKKYKRYFSFGCSYTSYDWLTVADLIGCNFEEYYNYGKPGGSNQFSWERLVRAHQKHNLNPETDYITFGVTGPARQHFIKEVLSPITIFKNVKELEYVHNGDLFPDINQDHDSLSVLWASNIENWSFAFERTYTAILSVKSLLDAIGVDYKIFKTIWEDGGRYIDKGCRKDTYYAIQKLIDIDEDIDTFWAKLDLDERGITFEDGVHDGHHTPEVHYKYLQKYFPEFNTSQTIDTYEKWKLIDYRSRERQNKRFQKFRDRPGAYYAR
jgi:hypothetical protein